MDFRTSKGFLKGFFRTLDFRLYRLQNFLVYKSQPPGLQDLFYQESYSSVLETGDASTANCDATCSESQTTVVTAGTRDCAGSASMSSLATSFGRADSLSSEHLFKAEGCENQQGMLPVLLLYLFNILNKSSDKRMLVCWDICQIYISKL